MESSSYEDVQYPRDLVLERLAHALRFDGMQCDSVLFMSTDNSDRQSHILNSIFSLPSLYLALSCLEWQLYVE